MNLDVSGSGKGMSASVVWDLDLGSRSFFPSFTVHDGFKGLIRGIKAQDVRCRSIFL